MNTYYVAKLYQAINPVIVETFKEKNLAVEYAAVMTKAGKGKFTVLEETCPIEKLK